MIVLQKGEFSRLPGDYIAKRRIVQVDRCLYCKKENCPGCHVVNQCNYKKKNCPGCQMNIV